MSTISFTPVVDGATATAASVNTPLSTIVNDYNGNITDANISASAAIATSKLAIGSAAYSSYTPTFTNVTLGSGGAVSGSYIQIGKTVHFRAKCTLGTAGVLSGTPTVSLPVASVALTANQPIGYSNADDTNNTNNYPGQLLWATTTTATPTFGSIVSSQVRSIGYTATTPFTWAYPDIIFVAGTYEAA